MEEQLRRAGPPAAARRMFETQLLRAGPPPVPGTATPNSSTEKLTMARLHGARPPLALCLRIQARHADRITAAQSQTTTGTAQTNPGPAKRNETQLHRTWSLLAPHPQIRPQTFFEAQLHRAAGHRNHDFGHVNVMGSTAAHRMCATGTATSTSGT